jgi:hypothetical protein
MRTLAIDSTPVAFVRFCKKLSHAATGNGVGQNIGGCQNAGSGYSPTGRMLEKLRANLFKCPFLMEETNSSYTVSNRDEHNCVHGNGDPFAGCFMLFLLTKRPKAKGNGINQILLIHESCRTCYICY